MMKDYLTILLIGLVSAFIGIVPLLKIRADKYTLFSVFLFYFLMPYLIYHVQIPGLRWWLKGSAVTLVLVLPLVIAQGRGYKRAAVSMLLMALLVGAFITFVGHYLL